METSPQHQIWVNPAKARYYEVHFDRDLFGDWALRKVWGGLGSRRGGTHNTGASPTRTASVSYTHLDVYKRQAPDAHWL